VTLIARWVTLRARWVTLRDRWVTLRARWVVFTSSAVGSPQQRQRGVQRRLLHHGRSTVPRQLLYQRAQRLPRLVRAPPTAMPKSCESGR
jgi:hypothetical protein